MKNYILVICIFFSQIAVSQNYIYTSDSKAPIEAVNVFFNIGSGIITNEDGYFELPEDIVIDSLTFSHLSFASKTVAFKDLKNNDTIYLDYSPIILDQVVLRRISPRDTVLKAIKNIDHNYITTPYNTFGFYRHSLQENKTGVEMIEVDFISYNNTSISTKILSARRTENFSTLGIKTHGGVAIMFESGDFVRNKAHFLAIDKLDEYEFKFEGQITYLDLNIYKIRFNPKGEDIETLRKGVLYIDSKSLAIVEIRYTYDKEKLAKVAEASEKDLSIKKPIYRLKNVDNLIRYTQLPNGKWTLNYIEANNLREGISKEKSYDYHLKAKLVINTVKTENPAKVKTNYNLTKDFSKVIKKLDNLKRWDDTYKLSLSKAEKQLLKDIQSQNN